MKRSFRSFERTVSLAHADSLSLVCPGTGSAAAPPLNGKGPPAQEGTGDIGGALPKPPRGPRMWAMGLAAVGGVLAAYANFFANVFQFDDHSVIERNFYIRNLRNLPLFFRDARTLTAIPQNAQYRPLAATSFALDYRWGGLDVRAYHVTQLFWLLTLGFALYIFLRLCLRFTGTAGTRTDRLALFGAALFCLHPVNSELMNHITLRSEMLAMIGVVSGLVLFIAFPRKRLFGLWLLPMLVGALAKPTALMMAPLLALWIGAVALNGRGPEKPRPAGEGKRIAIMILMAHAAAVGMFLFLNAMNGPHSEYGMLFPRVYFQSQIYSWLHYLRLFFLPAGLSADYDWEAIPRWHDTRIVTGAFITVLFLACAWMYAKKRPVHGRLFLFGALWFYVALAPSSSWIPLAALGADYRLSFPMIGLIICVISGAADLLERFAAASPHGSLWAGRAGLLVLLALGACTHLRNADWRTEESLWESVVNVSPHNARAWATLGRIYIIHRDLEKAGTCIRQSDRYFPGNYLNGINHAQLALAEDHFAEAGEWLKKNAERWPEIADARAAYGEWLYADRQTAASAEEYRQALALSPANMEARRQLLQIYAADNQWEQFCPLGRASLQISWDDTLNRIIGLHCLPAGNIRPPGAPGVKPGMG